MLHEVHRTSTRHIATSEQLRIVGFQTSLEVAAGGKLLEGKPRAILQQIAEEATALAARLLYSHLLQRQLYQRIV